MRVNRKLNSTDVIDVLRDLFILRGPPSYVRSDNGPEFVAKAVRAWIEAVGAKTAYIEPGSPWDRPEGGATSSRSMPGSATNCSMVRSSPPSPKQRSSSRTGAGTTTRQGRTRRSDGVRPPLKPSSRCPSGPSCTNNQTGPVDGGRSKWLDTADASSAANFIIRSLPKLQVLQRARLSVRRTFSLKSMSPSSRAATRFRSSSMETCKPPRSPAPSRPS